MLKGYLLVIAAVAATAFAANLALYEYWAFPLDSSVLQYLASPKEALASVTAGQLLLQLLVAAAVFGGMAWCYLRVLRLYAPARRSTHRAGSTLVLLLAAGVLFLPIRGGVSVATANVSKVYFSGRMFLNHAAVNPLFSFLSTLSDGDDALYEYEFFPEPERAAIFEPLRGDLPAGIGTDTLLRTRRPNVVLFLVESFGRSTVDERVGGEPVAPEFQRLKGEGVYFDNLFANSFRTDRGTVAVLSGFPAQTKMSVMKLPVKSQRLPSIARSLRREGYATSFYYGGDLNFTNTASYLYGTGFDRLTWQKDLHFDAPTSKWGYADDVVIDAFTDHVLAEAASQRPFFAAMLTLSSHEPFDVPFAKFDDPMLNAMAFTDACLGRFVERVRQTPVWKDLLVILIADHAYPYPYGIANSDALRHRIPMLWLGGAVRRPAVVETYGSQSDLAATLLAQLGIAHGDFLFSRDLFDPARPKFGYWCFNNGFGVADAGGAGFANKLVLDESGDIKAQYIDSSNNTLTGNYDFVPILEDFIKAHPDFSYRGARAILAVTGSQGIFGYRCNTSYVSTKGNDFYEQEKAGAIAIVEALKAKGYRLACYTYENGKYRDMNSAGITADLQSWTQQIKPIIGDLDTFVFAQASDLSDYTILQRHVSDRFPLLHFQQ